MRAIVGIRAADRGPLCGRRRISPEYYALSEGRMLPQLSAVIANGIAISGATKT